MISLVKRNVLCLFYVLLKTMIILATGSYGNNCFNLAKYINKLLGIVRSITALVRKGQEVKEGAQLLLIRKGKGCGDQVKEKRKERQLLKEMAKKHGAISQENLKEFS